MAIIAIKDIEGSKIRKQLEKIVQGMREADKKLIASDLENVVETGRDSGNMQWIIEKHAYTCPITGKPYKTEQHYLKAGAPPSGAKYVRCNTCGMNIGIVLGD